MIQLDRLMNLSKGKSEIKIGLIDGPVAINHPNLESGNICEIPGRRGTCANASSAACMHGTFIAGILSGKRGSESPSICPSCTLLVCPIFNDTTIEQTPSATPKELAIAIIECLNAGVNIINMSVALIQPSVNEAKLEEALDYAMRRGVLTVIAAGNQGYVGSSVLTRHQWSIPVVACDAQGRPIGQCNLGKSIGRLGLSAPGEGITSFGPDGKTLILGGTSVAAPFVTGTLALLWSLFPKATAANLKMALRSHSQRATIVPPLLNAMNAYGILMESNSSGGA